MSEKILPSSILDQHAKPSTKPKRFFQIDFLKAMMMVFVVMDHTFTHYFLSDKGAIFWERISIPILMIIMGFNLGLSFHKTDYTNFKNLYSRDYFEKKLKRYMIPYLLLYLVHGLLRIYVYIKGIAVNGVDVYDNFDFRYLGFTFFYGPGLWFIPVLFASILVFPLIAYAFHKAPSYSLAGTFLVEIFAHIMIVFTMVFNDYTLNFSTFLFLYSIFSMFSAVGLGIWISQDHHWKSRRSLFVYMLLPISLFYMILYYTGSLPIPIPIGDYHLFFFPYSAFLVILAMNVLPEDPQSRISNWIRTISKSTYHILLAQIFYFSIVYQFFLIMYDGIPETLDVFDASPQNYIWFFPVNLVITFTLGILWKYLENKFYLKVAQKPTYKKIYMVLIRISVIAYILWLIAPLFYYIFS